MRHIIYTIIIVFSFSILLISGCDSVTDSKSVSITAPSLLEPMDNDSNVSLTPTFKWNGAADKLQVATNSTFGNIRWDCTVTGTQYSMPSGYLESNQVYYWRAGKTSGSTVYWSTTSFRFKTQ